MRLPLLFLLLSFVACSSVDNEVIDDVPQFPEEGLQCCTQNLVHSEDSTLSVDSLTNNHTRANDGLYPYPLEHINLFSMLDYHDWMNWDADDIEADDYEVLEYPVHKSGKSDIVDICFGIPAHQLVINASNENGEHIAVTQTLRNWVSTGFVSRPCFFSSASAPLLSLQESAIKTPGNHATLSPLPEPIYMSGKYLFKFFIFDWAFGYIDPLLDKKYISTNGHIDLLLKNVSSLIKTQIIVTDMTFWGVGYDFKEYILRKDEFEDKCGSCTHWSIATFLDNVPNKFSVFQRDAGEHKGNSIVALSDQDALVSGVIHKDTKYKHVSYMGMGTETMAQGYMMPFDSRNTYLKYSFYYKGDKKKFKYNSITLKVPIKDLDIEEGSEICITTIIDVNDLIDAMNGVYDTTKSNASRCLREEDDRYGIVVEMPHHNLVNCEKL